MRTTSAKVTEEAKEALIARAYEYADGVYPGAPSYVRDALMVAWLHGYANGSGAMLADLQALMLERAERATGVH